MTLQQADGQYPKQYKTDDLLNDLEEGTGETDPGWGYIATAHDELADYADYLDSAKHIGAMPVKIEVK